MGDKEYQNPLKIEYYDRKGDLLKVGLFKDYKKFGNHWRVSAIEMSNVQTKKRPSLLDQGTLGAEVDEELFEMRPWLRIRECTVYSSAC